MAKLVTVEGIDKCGKETQSKLMLQSYLCSGYRTSRVEVPVKDCNKTYRLIYWMLNNGLAKRWPNTFQFIQFMNKLLFQLLFLPKLLNDNDIVILDRWSLSAVIYGDATGVNHNFNMMLFNWLKKPDITVIFHGTSFRRSTTTDDSYEKDTELQKRVAQAYHNWGVKHPRETVLISNSGKSVEEVHKDVILDLVMRNVP